MTIRQMLRTMTVATAACVAMLSGLVWAQGFPSKPVRLVLVVAPGGGGDIAARVLAERITAPLGQPVIFDHRPGGGGTIAANLVAKAPADGYTLLLADQGATVFATSLFKQLPYDPAKDLVAVSPIFTQPFIILAGPSLKAANLKELIEEARANPGKIAYGHPGIGAMHQVAMEMFKQRVGIDLNSIAYKGGALAVQDAVGGQIQLVVTTLLPTTVGLMKQGRLRPIAVMSKSRHPAYPDVPALSEVIPDFEAASFVGIWAPARTPAEVLTRLNAEMYKALRTPEVAKRYEEMGFEAFPRSLEETNQLWQKDLAVWPDAIKRMRITLD